MGDVANRNLLLLTKLWLNISVATQMPQYETFGQFILLKQFLLICDYGL